MKTKCDGMSIEDEIRGMFAQVAIFVGTHALERRAP